MHDQPIEPFAPTGNRVYVVDGYGIRVALQRGHLVVSDGIGRQRRVRRFARATLSIRRLIVLGHSGSVSLEALRWMHDVGLAFVQIDADGTVLTASAGLGRKDAQLRRAQALAMTAPLGVEVTRVLLRHKLDGQRAVIEAMGGTAAGEAIARGLDTLETADSLDALAAAEAQAAAVYWAGWSGLPIAFSRADEARVPEHWLHFSTRRSSLTGSPRLAVTPTNAVLNYLYALAEAEAIFALQTMGLDPGLGILHADQGGRASMALDLMEAVRPSVDSYALELLGSRVFRHADFEETPRGVCRLLPPMTHHLAETCEQWRNELAPGAEEVAQLLADGAERPRRVATKLTQTSRSEGRVPYRTRPVTTKRTTPRQLHPCTSCDRPISGGPGICEDCQSRFAEEVRRFFALVPSDAWRSAARRSRTPHSRR